MYYWLKIDGQKNSFFTTWLTVALLSTFPIIVPILFEHVNVILQCYFIAILFTLIFNAFIFKKLLRALQVKVKRMGRILKPPLRLEILYRLYLKKLYILVGNVIKKFKIFISQSLFYWKGYFMGYQEHFK